MTRLLRPLKHSCCDGCKFRLRATETPFKYGKSKRKKNEDNHWYFNEFCINPSCNDFDKIILIIKNWFKRKKSKM